MQIWSASEVAFWVWEIYLADPRPGTCTDNQDPVGLFQWRADFFGAGEVLLDEGLIKCVQGARGVCDKGHECVYKHIFIPAIPLQAPRMAISQEGNLVNSGIGWDWCVQGLRSCTESASLIARGPAEALLKARCH